MTFKPWRVGEQDITFSLSPDPDRGVDVRVVFTSDPNDASIKRLRIVPLQAPGLPATELTFKDGGGLEAVHHQPIDFKPWERPTDEEIAKRSAARSAPADGHATADPEPEAAETSAAPPPLGKLGKAK